MTILTSELPFEQPLFEAIAAVELAAEHLVASTTRNGVLKVTIKKDLTLLLNLDLELQGILISKLRSLPIVSEEMPETHAAVGTATDYFIVDPLDGTTSAKRFLTALDSQVGFGPMTGVVNRGKIVGVVFFNCPQRLMFAAEKGKGAYCWRIDDRSAGCKKLSPAFPHVLRDCGLLFYAGLRGELKCIEKIKQADLVENIYRFGGFANDCSRISRGFEQIQIQFAVKAWDLPASLLAAEAGLEVLVDPLERSVRLEDWSVQMENPLISAPPLLIEQLLNVLKN